jgi:DNA-binding response OmpR family regulator
MMGRVLIIEDDDTLRDVLQEALTYEGYAVGVADGHCNALAVLQRERFDLIVTDGIEFRPPYGVAQSHELDACQRAAGTAPRVLFTGYQEALRLRATDHGLAAIWPKPMGLDDLLTKIRAVLDRPPVEILADGAPRSGGAGAPAAPHPS